MGTKISKAEFETLPESLKAKFKPEGDDYLLEEPDITGLKKNKEDILKELKDLKDKYEGVDPEKAKKALADAQAAEDERLKAAGEFEKLKEQLLERHKGELEKAKADYDSLLTNLKRESLKNFLTDPKIGVKPDRVKSAIAEGDLENVLEFEFGEAGPKFKKKGGIGDEPELKALFTELKDRAAWCFESNGASGSGASGSPQSSGNAKTMPVAQFRAMGVKEQAAFVNSGGKPVD